MSKTMALTSRWLPSSLFPANSRVMASSNILEALRILVSGSFKKNRANGAVKSREETPKEGIYSHR